MMPRAVASLLFAQKNHLGVHSSTTWNMVPACLMWLIWRERNTRPFEDVERSFDLLKFLLIGTLFEWSHIWGFTHCISYMISLFLLAFPLICLYSFQVCGLTIVNPLYFSYH